MPHIMIVRGIFYKDIADQQLKGAVAELEKNGCTYENFDVSGALEIPYVIKMGAIKNTAKPFDGFIALGCVIRGETSHYDIVCGESARGLMDLGLQHGLVIGNAIMTCETMEQAVVRADPAQKNVAAHAVRAVLEVLDIKKQLNVI